MRPAADARRLVRVVPVMGTTVSFHVAMPRPADAVVERALDDAIAHLRDVDRRFSLYRPDSELSRLATGELAERDLSTDVRWVLGACDDLARATDGAFDARRHRADGIVDPSGFVKGWAVEDCAGRLDDAGARNWAVAAGGDIVASGEPVAGRPWRIGIRHPDDAAAIAAIVGLRRGAVATSGLYERPDHIRVPGSGAAPTAFRSVSVVGPSLAWADAYATAAFVMGERGLTWVAEHPGYHALAITGDGRLVSTPGMDRFRAAPEAAGSSGGPADLSGDSHAAVVS